jgi:GntR family transcriptional regulator/MocR family aminotransferase
MPMARRQALLERAERDNFLIVEDDYDGEFHFAPRPQPALQSIDTHGRVIYVGTFSKTLFPALRLGFVVVPERMIDIFDTAFASWVSGPATAVQATVSDFMDEGYFATHIRLMRRLYKARYEALMTAAQALPDTIRVQPTTSGFHTWAQLQGQADEGTVAIQARAKGVIVAPLAQYCLAPLAQKGLVLGFGSSQPDDIVKGVEVLRTLPALGG